MRLRIIAVVSWPLAMLFTVYVSPLFQDQAFKQILDRRASITIEAEVLSNAIEVRGFSNSKERQVEVSLISPAQFRGKHGEVKIGSNPMELGDRFQGVVSFRPSFKNGFEFKGNLKHLITKTKGQQADPFSQLRGAFLSNLRGLDADSAALVAGLAIGDDSRLSKTVADQFKVVSLTHLTAVSGANCAIVLGAVAFLLMRLPISRRVRILLSFGAIAGYLALVGPQPSVLRASVMVAVVLLGLYFGRRVHPLDAIALSVIGLFLFEPQLSLDYGFALSVLATLGLLVLAPPLAKRLENRMPNWLALVMAVTISAQIACLPILLVLQPALPVYSVFANLLAEPLVLPITMLGLIACLVSPILPMLAQGISFLASIPAFVIIFIAQKLANAPSATIAWFNGLTGVILSVLVTISFAGLLVARGKRVKAFSASALILVGLVFISQNSSVALARSAFYSGDYTLVNCDVGQGDGLVIRSVGQIAVVDVGREDPAIDDCLSNLGIQTIDLLVLTHFDMDHVGGVIGAITGREVKEAMLTSFHDDRPGADFAESVLEARGIPITRAEKGMTGKLGDFNYQVLSPHRDAPEAEDSNDGSITMLWQDSEIALFTLADLGEKGQLRLGQEWASLLNSGFGGRQVIVKVAHHGSADQLPEFYEAISPKLALISVGVHNSYGHPTSRTLGFLNLIGSEILRTDQMGAIGVSEVPSGLSVSVSGRS